MIKHIESFYLSVGKYSCYFDCLVKIAETEMSMRGYDVHYDHNTIIQLCSFHKVNGKQLLAFNWNDYSDTANFDVNYGAEILKLLTGLEWEYTRVDSPNYTEKNDGYVVRRWKRDSQYHFNMSDYDPLQNSLTVKEGKIDGYRVYKVK